MVGKKIPAHIKKLCEMLKEDRSEYQCAAAMVLGELKIKNSYVVRSLGEVLNNGEDSLLKGYILDAFEKIKSKESLKFLLPFLFNDKTKGSEFTDRAITIASTLGVDAAKTLKSMLKDASPGERCVINSIFIKMRSQEGLDVILESLRDEDEGVVSEICRLMKDEAKNLTPDEKKTFSARVEGFLKDKSALKNRHSIAAAIRILGYIGHPDVQSTLLAFTTIQNHPNIRSRALRALKSILMYSDTKLDVVKRLISYLDENDFTNIVGPTLEILISIPFQTRLADLVIKQLNNPHETVRRFAIRKMRELNSPKVVRVLVENLSNPDSSIRDLAAESLCWLDSARTVLLEKILEEDDLSLCLLYAKILKPHSSKFRSNQIKKLTERLHTLLDEESQLQDPFLFLLKTAAPDYLYESLAQRGSKLKQKKNYEEAVKAFKLLQKNSHYGNEARYDLAICQLKLQQKAKESESSIPHFQYLIKQEDFPLMDKLKGEKDLQREELYLLGSQLISKLQKDRAFGTELLKMVTKKHPRSKAGIASRKLLQEASL